MAHTPPPDPAGPQPTPVIPYPAPPIPPPHAITPDHLAAMAESKRRFTPIRREISVATFDAWSVAVFAGLTVLLSLGSPAGMFVGLGMGVVAGVEFYGIRRLKNLDPAAPRLLALNQLGFATVLILYGAYNLLFPGPGISAEVQQVAGADPEMAAMLTNLGTVINRAVYFGVIAFALVFQGGCALYHFTRTPVLRRYLDSTAPWLLQLHATGVMS